MKHATVLKVALLTVLLAAAAACGVKNELQTPSGKETPHGQTNPSTPPSPIGQ